MSSDTVKPAAVPEASAFDATPLLHSRLLSPPINAGTIGSLGTFNVLRVLGEGGMGVVVLAADVQTGEQVAIKLLKPALRGDARNVHRFLVEARHMQQMSHPNVIGVLGVHDGADHPYYVMPYMRRGSLSAHISPANGMPAEQALPIARQVAEAIAYAHSRGIIHRDLKPANVLVGNDGAARVCDFGLVRTVFNDSMVDASRQPVEGSAPYMSPAAARGEVEDTRCDIYSFGAMLYELLTGRAPYEGRSTEQIISKILRGPPDPILKVNPRAPASLAHVAEAAMARELRDRYASMNDVVEDLRRIERGEQAIGARRMRRSINRRTVAFVLIGLAAFITAVVWRMRPSVIPADDPAKQFSATSNPSGRWSYGYKHSLRGRLVAFDLNKSEGPLHTWRSRALPTPQIISNPASTNELFRHWTVNGGALALLPGANDELATVRWTCPRDGWYRIDASFIGTQSDRRGTGVQHVIVNDAEVLITARAGAAPLQQPQQQQQSRRVQLKAGGHVDFVASGAGNGTSEPVQLSANVTFIDNVDLAGGQPLPAPPTTVPVAEPILVATTKSGQSPLIFAEFSADGRFLATADRDGRVVIRDAGTLRALSSIATLPPINSLHFICDQDQIIVDSHVDPAVYSVMSGQRVRALPQLEGLEKNVVRTRDGRLRVYRDGWGASPTTILAAESDARIPLWTYKLAPLDGVVTLLLWTRDDKHVVVGSSSGKLRVLTADDGRVYKSHAVYAAREPALMWIPANILITSQHTGTLDVYNLSTGELEQSLAGHVDRIRDVAFTWPLPLLRTISADRSIREWNMIDGKCLSVIPGIAPDDALVRFGADARHLLVAHADGRLALYRVPDPPPFASLNTNRPGSIDTYDHRRAPISLERIEAEFFRQGAPGVSHQDEDLRNSGDGSRDAGVDVFRDAFASAGEYVGDTHAGEWLHFSAAVYRDRSPYQLTARVRGSAGARFHVELRGIDVSGPMVVPPHAREQWVTIEAPKTLALTTGWHELRVCFETTEREILELDWFGLNPARK